jgi:tetratricopeptide (TPR) repeat protein
MLSMFFSVLLALLASCQSTPADMLKTAETTQPVLVGLTDLPEMTEALPEEKIPAGKLDLPARLEERRQALISEPGDAGLHFQIGLLYAVLDPELALAYLRQAAILDPFFTTGSRRLEDAIVLARLKDEPAYTLLESGRVLAGLGEWSLAAEAFQESARLRPDYAEAWAFLGEAYQQLPPAEQPPDMAEATYLVLQKALSLDPLSVSANTFMGLYWKRSGHFQTAITYLLTADRAAPDNPALQVEIGSCTAESGDLNSALAYYQRAVQIAPKEPTYWRVLAEFTLAQNTQVREVGLPAAREAVLLAPGDPRTLDVLGTVLYSLGDLDSAERFLLQALKLNDQYAPTHLHLGITYLQKGEAARARHHIDLAGQLAPDTWISERAVRLSEQYFR